MPELMTSLPRPLPAACARQGIKRAESDADVADAFVQQLRVERLTELLAVVGPNLFDREGVRLLVEELSHQPAIFRLFRVSLAGVEDHRESGLSLFLPNGVEPNRPFNRRPLPCRGLPSVASRPSRDLSPDSSLVLCESSWAEDPAGGAE
ncbi:hypothetical protein [Streptomyces sp. NPDC007856]|uniref:hypothetical protein n=1 Tax=Streptomyces sp. NPDC007856 TaxID=3364781 RepID=UPI003694434A